MRPLPPIAALALLAACAPLPRASRIAPQAIAVIGTRVALDPADPARVRLGALRWRGGLVLTSTDGRFGGLSSLRWDGGVLIAAADTGDVVALTPREADGRLVGIAAARIVRANGLDGRPLPLAKTEGDFEALERVGRHGAILSLEDGGEVWRYRLVDHLPAGTPVALPQAAAWRAAQRGTNAGIEAQAIGGGVRLMISEGLREPDGGASATILLGRRESRLSIPLAGGFVPTDLVHLGGRRFVMLERDYRKGIGTWTRLVRFALRRDRRGWRVTRPETLAEFGPPLTADNMEGLALRRERGRTMLYMVSDDNFSASQRTLLMKWALVEPRRAPAAAPAPTPRR